MSKSGQTDFRSTTILAVRHRSEVAIGGDGQVTIGDMIIKHGSRKIRKLYHDTVLAGFAGAAADAITLLDRFEGKLNEFKGNMTRSAVELAKEWRTDKYLRHLQAMLVVADKEKTLVISGTGDIIEPDDGLAAVGSGGAYALAAARALTRHSELNAEAITREALKIAGELCVYTNEHILVETL